MRWMLLVASVLWMASALAGCSGSAPPVAAASAPAAPAPGLPPDLATIVATGHQNVVRCMARSPDGALLATGAADRRVVLWDVATRKELRQLAGHRREIEALSFSPDGALLASAAGDGVRVWDTATGRVVKTFSAGEAARAASFSADGRLLLTGGLRAALWDTATWTRVRDLAAPMPVGVAAFAGPGRFVIHDDEGKLRLGDLATGALVREVAAPGLEAIAVSRSGTTLVATDDKGGLWAWALDGSGEPRKIPRPVEPSSAVDVSTDGARALVLAPDGEKATQLAVVDLVTGEARRLARASDAVAVSLAPDGRSAFFAVSYVHETRGALVYVEPGGAPERHEFAAPLRSVTVTPDGRALIAGADEESTRVWSLDAAFEVRRFDVDFWAAAHGEVALVPGGKLFAYTAPEAVLLYRLSTGAFTRLGEDQNAHYEGLAVSPDEKTIATLTRGRGLALLDVASGQRSVLDETVKTGATRAVAFSGDGRIVAKASGAEVRLFTVADRAAAGVLAAPAGAGAVTALATRPRGPGLAVGHADGRVRIWDPASRALLRELDCGAAVRGLRFSDDGGALACGADDGAIRLLDPDTGALRRTLRSEVISRGFAFLPGGALLASADDDARLRLWDLERGAVRVELVALRDAWVALTPDGRFEASTAYALPGLYALRDGKPAEDERWERLGRASGLLDAAIHGKAAPAAAREADLVVQTGHRAIVRSLAFSPDGTRLASGAMDSDRGELCLWDLRTGMEVQTLGKGGADALVMSPDGALLAAGGEASMRLFDPRSGQQLGAFEHVRPRLPRFPVAFLGARRILGADHGQLVSWDLEHPDRRQTAEEQRDLPHVAVSADGLRVASVDDTGIVKVRDGATLAVLRSMQPPRKPTSIAMSPDGKQVATGDGEGLVLLWDAETGRRLAATRPSPYEGSRAYALAWSHDGKRLAAAMVDGVALWDLAHLDAPVRLGGGRIDAVAFGPGDKLLAAGGLAREVTLWDVGAGAKVRVLAPAALDLTSLAASPTKPEIAFLARPGGVRVWDAREGRSPRLLAGGEKAWAHDAAWSPDGARLAESGGDVVRVVDAATGALVWEQKGSTRCSYEGAAWAGEGKTVIAACEAGANHVSAVSFDAATGKERWAQPLFDGSLYALVVSPGGTLAAALGRAAEGSRAGSGGVIDLATGQKIQTLRPGAGRWGTPSSFLAGVFVGEGELALSDNVAHSVEIRDARTGEVRRTLGSTGEVGALAFDPRRGVLTTGDARGRVTQWDAATGAELRLVGVQSSPVQELRLTFDGRRLVSRGADGVARFWDAEQGGLIGTFVLSGARGFVLAAPDGTYASSPGAHDAVGFRKAGDVFPFEQFDARLNRPELVLARLGYASADTLSLYAAARTRRLERLGLREDALGDDEHRPTVAIVGAPPPATTRERTVELRVRGSDPSRPLARMLVTVNGVPVAPSGSAGIDLRPRAVRAWEETVTVELSAGRNKIQVTAQNDQGVDALAVTAETAYLGEAARPELHVIVVGVSKHPEARYRLLHGADDARAVGKVFDTKSARYGRVTVRYLLDDAAKRRDILAVRDELAHAGVDDTVVLFFAGHGVLDAGLRYFFVTYDTDPKSLASTGLSYADIEGILDGIPPRRKLLLMDTCHAGEVDDADRRAAAAAAGGVQAHLSAAGESSAAGAAVSGAALRELFAELRRGSGAHVIAASGGAEYVRDDNGSVFTSAILGGLRGAADRDRDGVVTVSELRDFVADSVRASSGGQLTPNARRENLDADFELTPGAPRGRAWVGPDCYGTVGPRGTEYVCGALIASVSPALEKPRAAALAEAVMQLTAAGPALAWRTTKATLALGGKRAPAISVEARLAGVADPTGQGTFVVLPDQAGKDRVAMCIAVDALPVVLARCQRFFEAVGGKAAPLELPR